MKAFPTGTGWNHEGEWIRGNDDGMDLRDYFASKAMQGILFEGLDPLDTAKFAYEYADAMMKAREK